MFVCYELLYAVDDMINFTCANAFIEWNVTILDPLDNFITKWSRKLKLHQHDEKHWKQILLLSFGDIWTHVVVVWHGVHVLLSELTINGTNWV